MIDDQGHILTNNHVVGDERRLEITLANGTTIPAELVGRDATVRPGRGQGERPDATSFG